MLKRAMAASIVAIPAVLSVALAQPALAADELTIERIAPAKSVVVASAKNVAESRKRLEKTPLWSLWTSEQVQSLVKELLDDAAEQGGAEFENAWEELGVKPEEIPVPTGTAGVALFTEMNEEIGQETGAFIGLVDYGDEADKAEELLNKLVERAAKERNVTIDEREVRGRTVRSYELPAPDDDFAMDPAAQMLGSVRTVHWTRDASRFLVSSSLVALEDALEVSDGALELESVARNADYQGALAQLDAKDAYAVLLTGSARPLVAPLLMGPGAVVEPLIGKLFGDVRAYTFGLTIDGAVGMVEQSAGIYIPADKLGLFSLLTTQTDRGQVPGFVGVDAVGYGRINVDFPKLMPLVTEIVKGLPPMFRDEIEPQLDQFRPALEEAFAHLGPEVHTMTTVTQPITLESEAMTVAIRTDKPEAVKPIVDLLGPSGGLAPRDFLGNTIYSSDFAPAAIGVGSGWVVFGPNAAVEQVFRSVGQANMPGLADEELFRYAMNSMRSGKVVGWGYTNVVASFAAQREIMKQMMKEIEAMNAELGIADDGGMEAEMGFFEAYYEKITPDLLAEHLGPATWDLVVGDTGFMTRFYYLPPRKDE